MYIVRSLYQRAGSTLLTVGSFGLVIFSLVILLAMVEGVNEMLIASGSTDRVLAFNENVNSENHSQMLPRDVLSIRNNPAVKLTPEGLPYASSEVVKTASATSPRGDRIQTNFRGVEPADAVRVHNQLHLVAGRFFNPASEDEVIIGLQMHNGLGTKLGDYFEAQHATWRIVGVFEDGGSTAESEIWTTAQNVAQAYNKSSISSVWIRVNDPARIEDVVGQINADPVMAVYATTEQQHYAQGFAAARGLQILAWLIAGIMAAGAVFSAMNTMYASIADRAGELAALRAIGFQRQSVLAVVITEALIVALVGGFLASTAGWMLDGLTIRTLIPGLGMIGFKVSISLQLLATAMGFSALLGLIGGWIPGRYAINMHIVQALNG